LSIFFSISWVPFNPVAVSLRLIPQDLSHHPVDELVPVRGRSDEHNKILPERGDILQQSRTADLRGHSEQRHPEDEQVSLDFEGYVMNCVARSSSGEEAEDQEEKSKE
jgi:hypothetical protein